MKTYLGTKLVKMQPMTRKEYNDYRGWQLPEGENGADEGYLVEYKDGGKSNDKRHTGYISWSPKEQADAAYRPTNGLTFGLALEAMKKGARVARAGWNGKGMWLGYVGATDYTLPGIALTLGLEKLPWIYMKTADGKVVPWLASQTDMLADDWCYFGEPA